MGQVCHPTAFRLGYTSQWKAGYFPNKENKIKFFQYNIFITKLLKNIFNTYTLPNYNFKLLRNYRKENELVLKGEQGIVANPFQRQGIYFSHIFNSFSTSLNINIFLFDQGFINIKKGLMEDYKLKLLHYHREFFQKKKLKYQFFSNFFGFGRLKRKYKVLKVKKLRYLRKRRKWTNRNRYWEHKWFNFKILGILNKKKINPLGIFDFITNNINTKDNVNIRNNININKQVKLIFVFLRLLKINKEYKKQFFIIKLLKTLLIPIIKLLKYKEAIILQKLLFFLYLIEMNVLKVSNYVRSLIYKTRDPLYNQVSKVVFLNIKLALVPNIFNKFNINFYGLQTRNISAYFILNFINFRLSQYIPINPILNEMINKIKKNSTEIYGFKILVTGRLTRKERASIILRSHGLVQTSQKSAKIE